MRDLDTNEIDNNDIHMASDESSSATIEIMYWIHRTYTDYFHQQQINTPYKSNWIFSNFNANMVQLYNYQLIQRTWLKMELNIGIEMLMNYCIRDCHVIIQPLQLMNVHDKNKSQLIKLLIWECNRDIK